MSSFQLIVRIWLVLLSARTGSAQLTESIDVRVLEIEVNVEMAAAREATSLQQEIDATVCGN